MNIFNIINLVLETLLKLISTVGLFWLFYKYYQVIKIDKEIKKLSKMKLEKELNKLQIFEGVVNFIDYKTELELKQINILLNDLRQNREDAISITPFIK